MSSTEKTTNSMLIFCYFMPKIINNCYLCSDLLNKLQSIATIFLRKGGRNSSVESKFTKNKCLTKKLKLCQTFRRESLRLS